MSSNTKQSSEAEVDEATAILIKARSIVERGWCRGANARDVEGNSVPPHDESAVAWCAVGALRAVLGFSPEDDLTSTSAYARLIAAISMGGVGVAISWFNDVQKTVEPVLAAFDRAIAGGR